MTFIPGMGMVEQWGPERRRPPWLKPFTYATSPALTAVFAITAIISTGAFRWWIASGCGIFACATVVVFHLGWPTRKRRWRGTHLVVLRATRTVVVAFVITVALVVVLGVTSFFVAFGDGDEVRRAGVVGLLSLAIVPTAWRLVTAQLHRPQIVLGETFVYRGLRHEHVIAWRRMHSARLTPSGVIVIASSGADILLTPSWFRVRPADLHAEILRRRAAAL